MIIVAYFGNPEIEQVETLHLLPHEDDVLRLDVSVDDRHPLLLLACLGLRLEVAQRIKVDVLQDQSHPHAELVDVLLLPDALGLVARPIEHPLAEAATLCVGRDQEVFLRLLFLKDLDDLEDVLMAKNRSKFRQKEDLLILIFLMPPSL
jgi:hypothetical protein